MEKIITPALTLAYLKGKISTLQELEDYFRTFSARTIKKSELIQALRSIRLNLEEVL